MLTMTDLFCGGGGSSSGAKQVPGVRVVFAANHWPLAVKTHNTNHPEADHDCADISQVDPRRYPKTDLLWVSPECTNHTQAKGTSRKGRLAPDANGDTIEMSAEERSRATMWDVIRFTEHHRYKAIIVENVVEAAFWAPFHAWLMAMRALGYEHQIVFLNSAHAQAGGDPAAQSRDRIYIIFNRVGDRKPNVERWTNPGGTCTSCGYSGQLKRYWKPRGASWPLEFWGRYKTQYHFVCPSCDKRAEPRILPAYSILDWTIKATRIGDKPRKEFFDRKTKASLGFHPLAPKTMARIAGGLEKHRGHVLAVPLEGRDGVQARPLSAPMRAQTTRAQTGIAMPFIAELRGGGSKTRSASDPLATVTASGNHHGLVMSQLVGGFIMRNNGSKGDGREHCTPLDDVMRTVTTKGHQSIVTVPWDAQLTYSRTSVLHPLTEPFGTITTVDRQSILATARTVEECYFRMLDPREVQRAMAFGDSYILLGNKREQVKMCGNAVTPPAARDLVAAVVEALEGSVKLNVTLAA